MADVMLFGEPMAMFVADTPGQLEDVERFTRHLAGAEVNVAIGLTRLGFRVGYGTKLGQDPFGRYIAKQLKKEGIEAQYSYDPDHWTGFQLKERKEDGDPQVVYFRKNSAAANLSPSDIDALDFSGVRHVHVTGIPPALSQSSCDATYRLIQRAREEGLPVSFDPNLRPTVWGDRERMLAVINDIASRCQMILPGQGEGELLTGSRDPGDIAGFYRRLGAEAVIVKLGGEGAYFESSSQRFYRPGWQVKSIVDTVGAGDGFAVGIISGMLEGLSPQEMLDRANAIGARQLTVAGDNEGLPTRAQLMEFMKGGCRP